MSISEPPSLEEPDSADPLSFGLKSIPEPLQRWWLLEAGNPYFDAAVRISRLSLDIPEAGFSDVGGFVDWVAKKWSRHGHSAGLAFSFTFGGQAMDESESLTRFHYRDAAWPIQVHELPGPCCPTDPLFEKAEILTVKFGIDLAEEEPGFGAATEVVVEYILLNRWRRIRSVRGNSVIHSISEFTPKTGRRSRKRSRHKPVGLGGRRGLGSQLPIWHQWWRLAEEGKTVPEIAGMAVETIDGLRTYEERTIRFGIEKVEAMMRPAENLNAL